MTEFMNFFDFDLTYMVINGLFSMLGFLGMQAWEYKKDERSYTWEEKKGDFLFGVFFIPLFFTFGAPYVWDYLDKDTWYNPLTSMTGGFLFDYLIVWAIKKAKKKADDNN